MKKLLATILAIGMTISLASCGSSGSQASGCKAASASGSGDGKLQKIGFISASWSDDYCKRMSDALVEQGPDYGFEVTALNASPNGTPDVTGYIEAVDTLAQKDLDGIIIQPLFSIPDYCLQFNKKNIPLCFLNIAPQISDSSKNLKYYYAGSFEEDIGSQLAEAMSKGLKDNAKICCICLMYGQDNTTGRLKGFTEWMSKNRPDVKILETNYVKQNEPTEAQSIFEDWIQKYGVGGFDGVATQSSMQTQGIVESMKTYGLNSSNVILGGISASSSDWIKDGIEYCDLYQDPYVESAAALDTIRKLIDGKDSQIKTLEGQYNYVSVPMTTMTVDNAKDYTSAVLYGK